MSGLAYAQDEKMMTETEAIEKKLVIVELPNVKNARVDGQYGLVPYRERRKKWGVTVSLTYSSYEPVNYEPNFVTADFGDVYSTSDLPMLELAFVIKRNLSFGSLGVELAAGGYENDSDSVDLGESSLLLLPIRVGANLALDVLGPEPLFVPYVSAGAYLVYYREELAGNSYNGNTTPALYAHAGVSSSLNWIDQRSARMALEDSGIQTTSIFAEVQKQMASSVASDPDFEGDLSWAAGLRVEF